MDTALLQARPGSKQMRVIVRHRAGASARVRQRLSQKGALGVRQHRGNSYSAVWTNPVATIDSLKSDPDFIGFSVDAVVTAGSAPPPPEPLEFDGQHLRATLGIQPTDSVDGVGVAIIDSGIAPNADLAGRITAFYDFTAGGISTTPSDGYGHGTHIAGLIAGNGSLSGGKYVGVATNARLIGLKVLNSQGAGYSSDVISALDFAVVNRVALGIDVINLSLGHPPFEPAATDPLVQAVERAVEAGIVVVASAGNHGYNLTTGVIGYAGITSPGNAPSAITVGSLRTRATATRLDDEVSMFSSRGPTWYDGQIKPDILAPGQALVAISHPGAALFQNPATHADVYPYIKLSGTSMASGVATGVVALILDSNRKDEGTLKPLTPNMVKAILQITAIPVQDFDTSTPAALEQGTGGINAAGAMTLARAIDPDVAVGSWWLETGVSPYTDIAGDYLIWAQQVTWGDHLVWGDTFSTNEAAWGQNLVWGDDDEHIVWGDSLFQGLNVVANSIAGWANQIVWGTNVVWADDDEHIVWGDDDEHIVWGDDDEHIVWGDDDEHIVWGDTVGGVFEEAREAVHGVVGHVGSIFGRRR